MIDTGLSATPSSQLPLDTGNCVGCDEPDAPHLGELRSVRVADGIMSDGRVRRCTPCQQIHRAAGAAR